MLSHFRRVRLQNAIFEIAGAKMKEYIEDVEEVREVIETKPHEQCFSIDLLESESENDDPKIV